MESEKVKEIKKWLEDKITRPIDFTRPYEDTLTLINELEIENKSLQDLCNKTYEDLTKEIDRLEKENTEQLKQFAERLKERILSTPHILGGEGTIIDETLKEFIDEQRK